MAAGSPESLEKKGPGGNIAAVRENSSLLLKLEIMVYNTIRSLSRTFAKGKTMASHADRIDQELTELVGLYQKDPKRFEQLSRQLIEEVINGFPPERRWRAYGWQFRLDATLSRYKDPVARMNKMVEILWEQVRRFQEVLLNPAKALEEKSAKEPSGTVISLQRYRKLH